MMSEELLKIRGGLDAPRPPSAARLAAEAFFSMPPAAVPDGPEPTVVVRRKQPLAADGEMSAGSEERDDAETRAPRVFRLETVAPSAEAPQALAEPEVEQGVPLVADRLPLRRLPRKKSRQLHGEVTIIRPVQDAAPQMSVNAEPPLAAQPADECEPASPQGRHQPVRTADQMDDAWPYYPKLATRIRELEAEAKLLKQREAAEAIQWIRQAIATYGLSPRELGFADHDGR